MSEGLRPRDAKTTPSTHAYPHAQGHTHTRTHAHTRTHSTTHSKYPAKTNSKHFNTDLVSALERQPSRTDVGILLLEVSHEAPVGAHVLARLQPPARVIDDV